MSAAIDYSRFVRVLKRTQEIAAEQDLPSIIAHVYAASVEAPVTVFLTAHDAYEDGLLVHAKEKREANDALRELDGPYRVARSAVVAVTKASNLPDTLKMQPTDTDKLNAIERLLGILDDHVGEPWADTLLEGEFGTKGAKAVKETGEAISANKALNKAQIARAAAYGPAYEGYLAIKRVVRDALGPSSVQYRRIHLRSTGAMEEAPAATPPNGAPADAPPVPAATPPAGIA